MPDPVVYWHGSVLAWRTGSGALQVVWCLNPAGAMPAVKPKAKRSKP